MTPFVDDSDFQLYVGDVREQLALLPDESVHCVVTSPPYWGLRDYGTGSWAGGDPDCDHVRREPRPGMTNGPAPGYREEFRTGAGSRDLGASYYADVCGKCGATRVDQQLGLEATPNLFVQRMVDVFREVRRVLRRDGTCWVNLGDSYASGDVLGRTDAGRNFTGGGGNREGSGNPGFQGKHKRDTGLKQKDLVGIPWRVAFALQADGWYLRSDIVWSKPNPMPESVTDRPTKAHEYVFLLTRSPRYFFDADAVREPAQYGYSESNGIPRSGRQAASSARWRGVGDGKEAVERGGYSVTPGDGTGGRNVRSVWEIATQPYPDAHFATFPEALPERCIKAGTSERGCCPKCGAPWERETDVDTALAESRRGTDAYQSGGITKGATWAGTTPGVRKSVTTTGWRPSCDCDDEVQEPNGEWHTAVPNPVPCTVLDPFMGSGTTALVARKHGRRSIGIELNPDYAALCARRLQQLSLFGTPA